MYIKFGTQFTPSDLDSQELTLIGVKEAKIELIKSVNQFIIKNKLNLIDDWDQLSNIKEIGKWKLTSARLNSLCETNLNLFPCEDYLIRKRIQRLYKLDKIPTIVQTQKLSQKWQPYRSIVAWWLWRWF